MDISGGLTDKQRENLKLAHEAVSDKRISEKHRQLARQYIAKTQGSFSETEGSNEGYDTATGDSSQVSMPTMGVVYGEDGEVEKAEPLAQLDGNVDVDPSMGKATASSLMTGRFSHMSAGVNQAAKDITGNNVPSYMGFDPIDVMAAREGFSSTIQGSAEEWGKGLLSTEGKLGGEVTRINPATGQPMGTSQPDVSRQDYVVALSMLDVSANEYLDKGAGENLIGHSLIEERVTKADEDFTRATEISKNIAGLYVSAATKESDISGARQSAVQNDIIDRMLSSNNISTLGLPNELSTSGLVRTQTAGGSGQGSALTTEEHLQKYADIIVKNPKGYYEPIAGTSEALSKEFRISRPSVKDSLFPLPKSTKANPISDDMRENNKNLQQIQYNQLVKDAKFARDTFRLTLTGETKGRASRTFNERTLGIQAENSYLKDDAAINDQGYDASVVGEAPAPAIYGGSSLVTTSQSSGVVAGKSTYPEYSAGDGPLAQILMDEDQEARSKRDSKFALAKATSGNTATRPQGSERGGMHGEKGLTEADVYVEDGLTLQEIIAEEEKEAYLQYGPMPMTDREAYLRETSTTKLADQGTKEWFEERQGKVTASMFTGTTKGYKAEDLTIALASDRLHREGGGDGLKSPFIGNSDTREGNDSEGKAQYSLMAHLNNGKSKEERMQFEDAFFVENNGMGASVDGRMFNPDGSSSGNVELKYLSSGSVEGAKKKYYEQMQFQMLTNEEDQTHFGVLNKDTNQFHYELIHADPKTQAALKASAEEALEAQGDVTAKDIQAMNKARARKPTQPVEKSTGQKSAYVETVEEPEEIMTAFDPTGSTRPLEPEMSARNSLLGQQMFNEDQHAAALDLANIKKIKFDKSPEGIEEQKSKEAKAAEVKENAERKMAETHMSAVEFKANEDRDMEVQHIDALAEDAKKASEALKGFEKALGKIGAAAVELADRLLKGNEEGMEITRLASDVGMQDKVGNVLGVRDELRSKGVSDRDSVSVLQDAGAKTRLFDFPATAGKELGRIRSRAAANQSGLEIPLDVVEGKRNTQELLAMFQEQIDKADMTPEQEAIAWKDTLGISGMTNYRGDSENIGTAFKVIDDESLLDANSGIKSAQATKEAAERYLSKAGKEAGAAAYTTKEIANSSTANTILGGISSYIGGALTVAGGLTVSSKAKTLMNSAKNVKNSKMASNFSKITKAGKTPYAIAATGGLMLANAYASEGEEYSATGLFGENDFTNFMDTPISEHLGFGDEEAEPSREFVDEAVPNKDLGSMAAPLRNSNKTTLESNVSVNVEVKKGSVETEVNDNGNEYRHMDTDNSLDSGG